jgi:hypothetical protein
MSSPVSARLLGRPLDAVGQPVSGGARLGSVPPWSWVPVAGRWSAVWWLLAGDGFNYGFVTPVLLLNGMLRPTCWRVWPGLAVLLPHFGHG